MEIFVLIAAVNDTTRIECIPVHESTENSQDDSSKAEKDVVDAFSSFTVSECRCHSNDTRDKLLSIIEAGCGTLDSFNALVRNLVERLDIEP